MSLPECSAIYFFGSIVGDAVLCSSRRASPLFSSVPALNDPSPIDDMGFCGMNFFSIGRHYGNTGCRCQLITEENLVFRENRGKFWPITEENAKTPAQLEMASRKLP